MNKREHAVWMLQNKCGELGRTPQKSDFDAETVSYIKGQLGPWPRALEAAGLKEPKPALQRKKRNQRKSTKKNTDDG